MCSQFDIIVYVLLARNKLYFERTHRTPAHFLVSPYVRLLFYNTTKFNTPNAIISEKWWKLFKRKNPSLDAIWLKWLFILVWHHLIHFWNVLTAHCCRINISLVKINFLMNDRYGRVGLKFRTRKKHDTASSTHF